MQLAIFHPLPSNPQEGFQGSLYRIFLPLYRPHGRFGRVEWKNSPQAIAFPHSVGGKYAASPANAFVCRAWGKKHGLLCSVKIP